MYKGGVCVCVCVCVCVYEILFSLKKKTVCMNDSLYEPGGHYTK